LKTPGVDIAPDIVPVRPWPERSAVWVPEVSAASRVHQPASVDGVLVRAKLVLKPAAVAVTL